MIRIALLDDYQNVALDSTTWTDLNPGTTIEVFHDHLFDEDALVERLQEFDVVMALRERTAYPRSVLERLPNLKLLSTAGMRNASIDVDAATDLGILVCGTGGSSRATMELTWALILSLLRSVPRENAASRSGSWQETVGIGLDGKTIGIIGLGNIGGQMAEVARAFHMNIIAWSQNLTAERAAECAATLVTKQELLEQADIVTIHLRLSDRTVDLISTDDIALMKPSAYLVNSSRGPIINEDALLDALQNKKIAGAGIDVFDPEPISPDHAILKLDNAVITPHLGYVTKETYANFYGQTVENVNAFMDGDPVRVINPDVLEKQRGLG